MGRIDGIESLARRGGLRVRTKEWSRLGSCRFGDSLGCARWFGGLHQGFP